MEASGGAWATDRPYIIGTQRCNELLGLEVYPSRFTATQRFGTVNGSISQWLYLA
jgi:hypothetical protein